MYVRVFRAENSAWNWLDLLNKFDHSTLIAITHIWIRNDIHIKTRIIIQIPAYLVHNKYA